MTTKKKKNPKYKAPYKSTNYLESGDTSSNLPKFWGGSSINTEGSYQNLTDLSEKTPASKGIINYEESNATTPKYSSGNTNFMDNFQQKGVYGAVGKASSGYFANKASQSNDEGDRAYNTGMGLVSQAGPVGGVIGGVTAIGDSIGDPIRKRVSQTDDQGNIKNNTSFQQGNIAGSLLNPAKSLSNTWDDKNISKQDKIIQTMGLASGVVGIGTILGNKRKKSIETNAKAQIAETNRLNAMKLGNEKALRDQEDFSMRGMNRVNNMEMDSRYVNPSNQSFAEGGNMDYPGKASDITRYDGGDRHENGGLTLGNVAEVEKGETRGIEGTPTADYIFSDRLKTLDNKTTFAMKSKNISNKYSLRPWDSISNNAKDRELQDLMSEHEVVKKASDLEEAIGKYQKAKGGVISDTNRVQNEMSMNDDVFAKGGGIHIKPENRGKFTAYKERTGKTTEEALHSKNPHVRQMANFARNASKWHHAFGGDLDNSHMYPTGGKLLEPQHELYKNDPVVKEINDIGDINDPRLYDTMDKASRYMSVLLHSNTGEQGAVSDLSKAYINNFNKKYGKDTGYYYDPDQPKLHNVFPDEDPIRYKQLQDLYTPKPVTVPGMTATATRALGDSASYGVRASGGNLPKYAFGDDIANNSEYINAGSQGAIQLMRSNMINRLQPNKLDYTPISYLNESKYASPLSNVAFRPTRNDEEIQGLNTAYRGAEKASSEYADSGDYLNRMNAIGAAKSSNIGKAWEDHYNQEAQRRMQVDEFNKGIQGQNTNRLAEIGMKNRDIEGMNVRNKMSTQEYSNAEKDALNNLKIQNYGDWSNYVTGATSDFAKRSAYNDAVTLEQSKYPQYEFYRDENGRMKSRLKKKV
jgi:hypothetical protein